MGRCQSIIREVRFIIDDELTHAYVRVDAAGDCPIGVQGWHHKVFPASVNTHAILTPENFNDHLLWGLEAPRENR